MLKILAGVVSRKQEQLLAAWLDSRVLAKAEPLDRHFDGVLHNAKEGLISTKGLFDFMPRVGDLVRPLVPNMMDSVHVLELGPDGWIDLHFDQNCGAPIVGLSLLQPCTMVLSNESTSHAYPLPPRSLYVMDDEVCHRWKHSIPLAGDRKGRRISVIFRANQSLL